MTWKVPARLDELSGLIRAVSTELKAAGLNEMLTDKVILPLEELFVNVASYAYPSETGDIWITCEVMQDLAGISQVVLTLEDEGIPYNPLENDTPDISLDATERELGGLGIFMVRQMVDGIDYRYEGGRNRITTRQTIHAKR